MFTLSTLEDMFDSLSPAPYSGRGMYGAYCFSIRFDGTNEMAAVASLIEHANDYEFINHNEDADFWADFADFVARAKTDNMGLGIVVYWPKIKMERAPIIEDEEEDD